MDKPLDYSLRFVWDKSLIVLIIGLFCTVSKACIGFSSSSLDYPPLATMHAGRSRALAALSLDKNMRAAKCGRTDFGIYKAEELRALATIYEFNEHVPMETVNNGGALSCGFDSPEKEMCAWYAVPLGGLDGHFRRGRFESFFELEKFDCTSDRTFPLGGICLISLIFILDNYFLLIGGNKTITQNSESFIQNRNFMSGSAAGLEIQIPCQFEKAILKFDYWSNNETPVLKICITTEKNPAFQCEESRLDINPLTFEIPQNLRPFRLRIQVENVGFEDIVFIDNVEYEAKICQIDQMPSKEMETKEANTIKPILSTPVSAISIKKSSNNEVFELKKNFDAKTNGPFQPAMASERPERLRELPTAAFAISTTTQMPMKTTTTALPVSLGVSGMEKQTKNVDKNRLIVSDKVRI